jgi:preprotein translocase subunit Sss1
MATRPRRWPTPEECVASLKLDPIGFSVLCAAIGVSGIIIALLVRAISG